MSVVTALLGPGTARGQGSPSPPPATETPSPPLPPSPSLPPSPAPAAAAPATAPAEPTTPTPLVVPQAPPTPPVAPPPAPETTTAAAPPPVERPRLSLALGMGVSFDSTGLSPQRTAAVPSFFAVGGFGDGFVGIDFGVFASTASGRFRSPDAPVDRLAVDAMLVLRPLCHGVGPDETAWGLRLLRTLGGELGVGYERDGRGVSAEQRIGPRVGGRIELPLTSAADPSQLRLRLAVRRLFAGTKDTNAADVPVSDTALEVYGALAVVF
ncbi:MAG TPA: hypothetical protein VGL59_00580 [Polyangia bacterium]